MRFDSCQVCFFMFGGADETAIKDVEMLVTSFAWVSREVQPDLARIQPSTPSATTKPSYPSNPRWGDSCIWLKTKLLFFSLSLTRIYEEMQRGWFT